ncbi:TrmH family RNA methyltransferase [Urechidicola croceus]|uniref:tRNA (guanosine(18)-2'-O)-methyltransferase n=1 Tax=Urechidicola croceus TaxID=1850246 RepID=A0A1D8P502_9FLAO|nr:RNA methyltransferase [Urechidicola croceus]AOW19635.1 rRNA methyltransferase [Urechidicola croceus]
MDKTFNQDYYDFISPMLSDIRKEKFDKILAQRTKHFTVILEDLYQKHNTSAVVRSCDIFGIQDVHIIENKYKSYMSNQVGKGSQKWVDFHHYKSKQINTQDCIDTIKSQGYQLVATTPHNDSCLLHEFDITKKSAFVFGVEKEGVSDLMMEQADGFLKIPMVGFTESLNVSVAAAIVLQSTTERLRRSDVNWKMTNEEIQLKKLEWMEKTIKSIKDVKERYYSEGK